MFPLISNHLCSIFDNNKEVEGQILNLNLQKNDKIVHNQRCFKNKKHK